MNRREQKIVQQCNDLLRTELGGAFQREGRNIGGFAWIFSESKQLKFFIRDGHKEVLQNGVVKLVPEYKERSILPDGPEFRHIWVMCYTDQQLSEDEWLRRFGTEIQQVTYWRPVMIDPDIETFMGRAYNPKDIIKYVTLPHGVKPNLIDTNRFIGLMKEARSIAKQEASLRAEVETKREEKLRQDRKDYVKSYALPSLLKGESGGDAHIIVPGTINPDGTIKEAAELAERNRILLSK